MDRKLNRVFAIGDQVVLLKNMPDEQIYKGSLCTIIAAFGSAESSDDKSFYEIQFDSNFRDDDLSRRSQKRYRDFEFPSTLYVAIVSGKDIIRLVDQNLRYKTWFC